MGMNVRHSKLTVSTVEDLTEKVTIKLRSPVHKVNQVKNILGQRTTCSKIRIGKLLGIFKKQKKVQHDLTILPVSSAFSLDSCF